MGKLRISLGWLHWAGPVRTIFLGYWLLSGKALLKKIGYLLEPSRNFGIESEIKDMKRYSAKSPLSQLILSLALSFLLWGPSVQGKASAQESVANMTAATAKFLSTLTPAQAAKAQIGFDDAERTNWGYVPKDRLGVPLKDLNQSQRKMVHGILKSMLSESGHQKVENIISLEAILFALEGAAHRDVELYYLSIFGEPTGSSSWGWRFEGHHLSLNVTVANGVMLATAPNFWGANPAEVRKGSKTKLGFRTLKDEEDVARELLASLSSEQKEKAIFEKKAFRDIVTKAKPEVDRMEPVGIEFQDLKGKQKKILWKLIHVYLDNMRPEIAQARLDKIEKEGEAGIAFGWAGSEKPGKGHYYRVQGPSFLIEYDNVQGGANHIHTVWRDFDGDFGRDLLKEHYSAGHSH